MRNAKQKAATSPKAATSNANAKNPTACRCAKQGTFAPRFGFPPPPKPSEGPLADYLEANPGWHSRANLCAVLGLGDRELRLQAEFSDGMVIFGSGQGQGLKHLRHAAAWEKRQCSAELRGRGASHYRRADNTDRAWIQIGGQP